MAKQRKYYGADFENNCKPMYAVVTGQMADGSLVYTKIEMNEDGTLSTDKNGEYILLLDEQYERTIKHGCNVFFPL